MTHVKIYEGVPGVDPAEQYFVHPDHKLTPVGEWLPGFEKFKHPNFPTIDAARTFCDERGWNVTAVVPFEP